MSLTEQDYQRAIARILDRNNHHYAWGVGFLIAPRYVLTCAHVVEKASGIAELGSSRDVHLEVDFPQLGLESCTATLIWAKPCPHFHHPRWGEDIAVLELPTAISVEPLPLVSASISDTDFKVWGFSEDYDDLGDWAKGQVLGFQMQGWFQLESRHPITGGFSGGPVWSPALQGIIGMVTVSDEHHDYRKASAIFASVLTEMVVRYCPLLEILQSLPSTTRSIVQTTYQQSRPEKCAATMIPTSLLEQLQELGGIENGKYGVNCLVEFCTRLVVSEELSHSQEQKLQKWVESEFGVNVGEFEELCEHLAPQQQQQAAIPTVLVMLTPVMDGNRYTIEAGYIHDVQEYDYKTGQGYEQLTVTLTEPLSQHELTARMPQILEELLLQTCDRWAELEGIYPQVEFFLPMQLINHDVEQYPVDLEECPQAIGRDFPVVVRFWERLGYKLPKLKRVMIQKKWRQKWGHLQTCCHQTGIELLTCGDRPSERVCQDLNAETTIAVKITKGIDNERHKTIRNLMYAGIPIALWLRKQFTDCSCTETLNELLAQSLNSLPKHLTQHRQNAPHHEPDHLSHHLSLLWDDPQKIPPETRLTSRRL
ncbi:MAG: trypsin-like peptidase domain-containing protein [Cyanobacteria bacterium P01_G01_bin.54]